MKISGGKHLKIAPTFTPSTPVEMPHTINVKAHFPRHREFNMLIIVSVLIFAFELNYEAKIAFAFLWWERERERDSLVTLANNLISSYRGTIQLLRREASTNSRESATFAALSRFTSLRRTSLLINEALNVAHAMHGCSCMWMQNVSEVMRFLLEISWKYRELN